MKHLFLFCIVNAASSCMAQPAFGQQTQTPSVTDSLGLAVSGCWVIDIDSLPSPWPDSFAHLPAPDLLPEVIKLSPNPTPYSRIPGNDEPEDAKSVDYPAGYERIPFRYWRISEEGLLIGSYSPAGFKMLLFMSDVGRLVGTLRSYGAGDFTPRPEPQEWSTHVTLDRVSCEGFN